MNPHLGSPTPMATHHVVHAPCITCRWCAEPTAGRHACRHCSQHHRIPGVADAVAPLTYAIAATESGSLVKDYKNHPSRRVRRQRSAEMARLLSSGLALHEPCLAAAVGIPIGLRATVPSLTHRPGTHPFHLLARDVGAVGDHVLTASPSSDCHRVVSATKFLVPHPDLVVGRHVLILDDVWTTGSNAQSAALTLTAAGAAAVSILIVGRWLNPAYPPTRAFLNRYRAQAFGPERCPVSGGACAPSASIAPHHLAAAREEWS